MSTSNKYSLLTDMSDDDEDDDDGSTLPVKDDDDDDDDKEVYYTDSDSEGKAPTIIETFLPDINRAALGDKEKESDEQELDESEEDEEDENEEEEEQNENEEEEDIISEEDVMEEVEEHAKDEDENVKHEDEGVKREDEQHVPLVEPSVESSHLWVDDTPCDENGEPLAEELYKNRDHPLNHYFYTGIMQFCQSAPIVGTVWREISMADIDAKVLVCSHGYRQGCMHILSVQTERQEYWHFIRREVEKRWLMNWPREQLDEMTRYTFYGNEKRQAAAKRHKNNKHFPKVSHMPEPPPQTLTHGRDGREIKWVGPGGINAKGYRKIAYMEKAPQLCDEPIEYDDMGYRIVLDGPPDMPSKFRRRVVFNEQSWQEWWAHQRPIEERQKEARDRRREEERAKMASERKELVTSSVNTTMTTESASMHSAAVDDTIAQYHDHRTGFVRTVQMAGKPGRLTVDGEFDPITPPNRTAFIVSRVSPLLINAQVNEWILAEIVYADAVDDMYVIQPPEKVKLFELQMEMHQFYTQAHVDRALKLTPHIGPDKNIAEGDMVVAMSVRGLEKSYDRCLVVNRELHSAVLYYIDIGKFDRVSFDMLYRCDPKFQDMPPSMFPIALHNVPRDAPMAADPSIVRKLLTGRVVWLRLYDVSFYRNAFLVEACVFAPEDVGQERPISLNEYMNSPDPFNLTRALPQRVTADSWLTKAQQKQSLLSHQRPVDHA